MSKLEISSKEIALYDEILKQDIFIFKDEFIRGSGYVLYSLQASLWCFLNSETYEETVLKAVNLGEDTDTTGAITGGLAGLYFGFEAIPETWKFQLARYDDIDNLIVRFHDSLN